VRRLALLDRHERNVRVAARASTRLRLDGPRLRRDDRAQCSARTARGRDDLKQDKLFLRRLTAPLAMGDVVAGGDVEGTSFPVARHRRFRRPDRDRRQPDRHLAAPLGESFLVQTQEGNLFALSLKVTSP